MDGNMDEAVRCIDIAMKALTEGKLESAEKFLKKSIKLFPTPKAKELLAKLKSTPTTNGRTESLETKSSDHQRGPSGATPLETRSSEPEYTTEQLEAVKRVETCKDYYEILMVTKAATDSEIKKSYRTLSLVLHPDKNKAPGAVEAFKAIGIALAILTDPEKRKSYDLHVNEDAFSGHSGAGRQQYTYTVDMNPEEFLIMFFGGHFRQTRFQRLKRRLRMMCRKYCCCCCYKNVRKYPFDEFQTFYART